MRHLAFAFIKDLAVGVLLVVYIHLLHVWLAHMINMLGEMKESHENAESWGAAKYTKGFGCYTQGIHIKHKHCNNAPTNTTVGYHHTGALNSGGKVKICKIYDVHVKCTIYIYKDQCYLFRF